MFGPVNAGKKIQQPATDGATEEIDGKIAQEHHEDPKVLFSVS